MTPSNHPAARRTASEHQVSNTDIVLHVLLELGGGDRPVHIEDLAESAWQKVPRRFSWPKLQRYPDLDAVDVTLRAAKKNEGLVAGSKREGWMLTPVGIERAQDRHQTVSAFITTVGQGGRTENRRERGGGDSSTSKRMTQLQESAAAIKYRTGHPETITVYDFLAFFNINQYMPSQKYKTNRQAVENLVRGHKELLATANYLHSTFGDSYKDQLQQGRTRHGTT